MGSTDKSSPTQVMSPRTTSSQRLTSSSIRSPWTSNGSPSNGSPRTWITTMPQSVRCSLTYTENKSITPSEKACLLVSRRRQCPIERSNPLLKQWQKAMLERGNPLLKQWQKAMIERGNPLLKQVKNKNPEHAQIRTLLDRQREQILADCQTEIRKHKFQADYDRRSTQKVSETIESQPEELHRAQADGRRRQDHQLLHEKLLKQNWDLREAHEGIEAISGFHIRHNCKKKIVRRPRQYPWTHWQDTGLAKWNWLYEWFKRFSRCWISTQWTFPRYQSTCLFLTSSSSWWTAKPFKRNAEPQRWAAKHLGHAWFFGIRFLQIQFASSTAPFPQELDPQSSGISEPTHSSTAEKNENRTPVQDQRCQSRPSAKNSVIPCEGDSSK